MKEFDVMCCLHTAVMQMTLDWGIFLIKNKYKAKRIRYKNNIKSWTIAHLNSKEDFEFNDILGGMIPKEGKIKFTFPIDTHDHIHDEWNFLKNFIFRNGFEPNHVNLDFQKILDFYEKHGVGSEEPKRFYIESSFPWISLRNYSNKERRKAFVKSIGKEKYNGETYFNIVNFEAVVGKKRSK